MILNPFFGCEEGVKLGGVSSCFVEKNSLKNFENLIKNFNSSKYAVSEGDLEKAKEEILAKLENTIKACEKSVKKLEEEIPKITDSHIKQNKNSELDFKKKYIICLKKSEDEVKSLTYSEVEDLHKEFCIKDNRLKVEN